MLGQASAEFLILLGVLSLIFVVIFASSQGYQFYSDKLRIEQKYRNICDKIKSEIETALEIGPIYNRTFYLPSGTYIAKISNYEIEISSPLGTIICRIPVNLNVTLSQGKNTIIYNESGIFIK